jgi:uncharacterized membrane protein
MADTDEDTGRRRRGRGRDLTSSVASFVASAILYIAIILAAILGLSILFFVFDANPENAIVEFVESTAVDLAGPFRGLFGFEENIKMQRVVNFGIAALVYLAIGTVLSRIIRRLG